MKLAELSTRGELVTVRGAHTREIRNQKITLTRPLERCIVVPGRNNNPFAAIYETLWVIAGRNDIGDLTDYLPRAPLYSDDGVTWRAGYGPRLRNWAGVDQLRETATILRADPTTRRAVMSIFDPATDFRASNDIPCTNWLHAVLRDGKLDLSVVVRSNDLMWGFSGINTFEWSVLQEMLAYWSEADVGIVTYTISSLHLYERHFTRAQRILHTSQAGDPYTTSPNRRFCTPLDQLDQRLDAWFQLEAKARKGAPLSNAELESIPDPLLRDFLTMIDGYWANRRGEPTGFENVLDAGLKAAALEFVHRGSLAEVPCNVDQHEQLERFLIDLHRHKTRHYGDSWKRRGEQIGILANIARKSDRLARLADHLDSAPAVAFDTAVDLLVYSVKYETYLRDQADGGSRSDGTDGFEHLLPATRSLQDTSIVEATARIADTFHAIEEQVESAAVPARLELAHTLSIHARALADAIVREQPWVLIEASAATETDTDTAEREG
ncbi:thymidylate synthase [Leifsonia sp. NPDC102414]|uniref:thymidylate synthase n=1 Tax=Leifsonia sp. NPDC102414 TaxID=3364124 RepID=UPI00381A549D